MIDTDWIAKGREVCVVGLGLDRMVHYHTEITHVTVTQIATGNGRFRKDSRLSIPQDPTGRLRVSPTCQKAEEV